MKRIFLIVLVLLMQLSVYAQKNPRSAEYHYLGVQMIGSYFFGDVATNLKTVRGGIGLQYLYKLTPNASFTTSVNYIRLVADDYLASNVKKNTSNAYIRNLHMRNDVIEFSMSARYEIFPCNDYFSRRKDMNFYGTMGLGVLYTNPQAKDSTGQWRNLQSIHTENKSYGSFTGFIPVATGMQYKINTHMDLEFELGYRFTFTDYLDDAHGTYVDPATLQTDEAKYFSNRSAEATDVYTGNQRDLDYIQNDLGYPILTTPDGYSYVSSTAPGQARGTRFGLDGYFVAMIRLVYIIPR